MTEQWMSIVEYARMFRVSDMTVRRRIKTGKLHAVLKEGKYYIPVTSGEPRGHSESMATPRNAPHTGPASHAEPGSNLARRQQHAAARPMPEMTVIKGHPAAHTTIRPPVEQGAVDLRGMADDLEGQDPRGGFAEFRSPSVVPDNIRGPLLRTDTSIVESKALLAYCEATLRRVNESERKTIDRFKAKLEAIEAVVSRKDMEINALRQQVEDLQLLVKMMEKRKDI